MADIQRYIITALFLNDNYDILQVPILLTFTPK